MGCRGSLVGRATAEEQEVKFKSRVGQEFSIHHELQAGRGAHPASYTAGTGGLFARG
jgi:hypothetical protein